MNKLIKLAVATILVSGICAPCMVLAQGGGATASAPAGAAPSPGPLSLYQEAGATPEQQKKISAAGKEFEEIAKNGQKRLQEIQKRIDELTMQPLPDEKAVMKAQDDLNKLIADLNNARARMMLKARQILTPEQRLKVVELIKKHRAQQQR